MPKIQPEDTAADVVTEASPVASAPAAERQPVELWAERAGMLPEQLGGRPQNGVMAPDARGVMTALAPLSGAGAPRLNPEFWKFAAARAMSRWAIGAEVTEAEFTAAVELATTGHSSR